MLAIWVRDAAGVHGFLLGLSGMAQTVAREVGMEIETGECSAGLQQRGTPVSVAATTG